MVGWLKEAFNGIVKGEGIVSQVLDKVSDYIPSKEAKARLEADLRTIAHKQQIDMLNAQASIEDGQRKEKEEFNKRTTELEGTASDLNQAGWIGRIILFLRGAQRPVWGWGAMYFDFLYFTNRIELDVEGKQLLYLINALVLSFLFGERAFRNIAPMIKDLVVNRKSDKK